MENEYPKQGGFSKGVLARVIQRWAKGSFSPLLGLWVFAESKLPQCCSNGTELSFGLSLSPVPQAFHWHMPCGMREKGKNKDNGDR